MLMGKVPLVAVLVPTILPPPKVIDLVLVAEAEKTLAVNVNPFKSNAPLLRTKLPVLPVKVKAPNNFNEPVELDNVVVRTKATPFVVIVCAPVG